MTFNVSVLTLYVTLLDEQSNNCFTLITPDENDGTIAKGCKVRRLQAKLIILDKILHATLHCQNGPVEQEKARVSVEYSIVYE